MTDNDGQEENKLIAERRRKLASLREGGNPYPNDFQRNALAEELQQMYGGHDHDTLEGENINVAVAGRMMVKRVMGKASFIKLQDRSGDQLVFFLSVVICHWSITVPVSGWLR